MHGRTALAIPSDASGRILDNVMHSGWLRARGFPRAFPTSFEVIKKASARQVSRAARRLKFQFQYF